ncbi:MAG TPA: sialidase family protein [Gemmatimonadaceae bacterium]|nr:sialidase family protein [Gemmatimonadaceae bacterium]
MRPQSRLSRIRIDGLRRAALLGVSAVLVGSCDRPPLTWRETMRKPNAPSAGWRLLVDGRGTPALDAAPTAPFVAPTGACPNSIVFASAGGGNWFTAWWQPRADSSARLMVSRSTNAGQSWTAPVAAESRDTAPLGCARPNPALAADSAAGVVHLAYFIALSRGSGVWYAQSRDQGATWPDPVGVFYGDDPAHADVAARHDTVIVAYEYPNDDDGRVGVALSYDAGHEFTVRMPVSPGTERASDPRVALGGGVVAVGWTSGEVTGGRSAAFTVVDVAPLGGGK